MLKLPSNLFDSEFPRQFNRFTSAFEGFARQVSLVLGSVNPHNNIRSFLQSSSLFISSKELTTEWADFIRRLNGIADNDIDPHFALIGHCLAAVFSAITHLHRAAIGRKRNDMAHLALDQLQVHVTSLRNMAIEIMHRPKSRRFNRFDEDHFDTILKDTIRITGVLYDRCCPRMELGGGADFPGKREVITAASTIGILMSAAARFSAQINTLQRAVIRLNGELCLAHDRLNLQFAISLTVTEQNMKPEDAEVERVEVPDLTATPAPEDEPDLTATPAPEDEPDPTATPASEDEPDPTATPVPVDEAHADAPEMNPRGVVEEEEEDL
jgi:hypothetical protein